MANKIILKRSAVVTTDGSPKLPTTEQLDYGEVALNYAEGVETFSIKNSSNEIVTLSFNTNLAEALSAHQARNDNPHGVTKAQVGLGNVDNTADVDKPISTAQQTAINAKLNNAANGGIVNNLTTNDSNKALSAAQGIALSQKIDLMTGGAVSGLTALENRVAGVEQEISEAISYIDDTLAPKAQSMLSLTV